jgi:FkbH-like protein
MSTSASKSSQDIATRLADVKALLSVGDFSTAKGTLRRILRSEVLGPAQYGVIGNFVEKIIDASNPGDVFRVAVLGSSTTQPVATAVRCALLAEGRLAEVYEAPFAAYIQEILSPASGLYEFRPDMVLIATSAPEVSARLGDAINDETVEDILEQQLQHWRELWTVLDQRLGKPVLQHVCEVPESDFLGIADRRAKWSPARMIEEANRRLLADSPSFVRWVDVDRLAARIGRQNWHDMRLFHHGKYGFSPRFLHDYIALLSASVRGTLGKTPKALILDLDNTLWGGVIGDDGLDGIKLGVDTPDGEAYLTFCRYVKRLGQRGVILGICSKNEASVATEVFDKHPHMPLGIQDFAVVSCNWDDKASNLQKIADELNIDISAIVFVDDNPAECELVRQALPEVFTVQMDGDPALFVRKLDQLHLFDLQEFSDVDLKRTASYQARAMSARLKVTAPDFESYLVSLTMCGSVWSARPEDLSRLAQMEVKTNQFNLTTRRWTAEQLMNFMTRPDHDVLCFSLVDRFADHGLVGSMIVSYQAGEARILSWLLSCRVFSRTCEEFIRDELIKRAKERGIATIVGEYSVTDKNAVVSDLFKRIGFETTENNGLFRLDLPHAELAKTFISKLPLS